MSPKASASAGRRALRRRAEERVRESPGGKEPPLGEAALRRLVHELQVHQVELELQNEELRRAHDALLKANEELREAQKLVKILGGMLPICSVCKKIRDGGGNWHAVEVYVSDHSEAEFSHGLCPECLETLYPPGDR